MELFGARWVRRAAAAGRRCWRPAALLGLLAIGLLAAPATATAEPVQVTDGARLEWGFKQSWLTYVGTPATADGAESTGEGSNVRVSWAFDSGSFDPNGRTTVLRYRGSVRWTKYPASEIGIPPPPGYDGPMDIHLLDVALRDPIVTIGGNRATISAVASSRQLDTWQVEDFGRVDVVTLDVRGLEPTVAGGQTSWPAIPAVTNSDAGEVFGSNYPAGIPVDRVAPSYTGPGGAPDFSEQFDAPGTLRLELEENVFSIPEDSPSEDNQRFSTVWADPERLIAHRAESNVEAVFPPGGGPPAFSFTMTFQAFDLRQMRNVGDPLTVAARDVDFVDASTGRIFLSEGGFAGDPHTQRWVRYDADQGGYVEGELAEPIPKQDPHSTLSWDPVGGRAYEIAGAPGDWSVFTYVEQADGSWVRREHPLPAAPGGDAGVDFQRGVLAVASDGSIVALADNRPGDDAPARIPGAYRIVVGETGPASAEPIAGTEVDNTLAARYRGVEAGPDGVVALARFGQEQGGVEQVVQLLDATPASGPIGADAPVALPFQHVGHGGLELAFDPEDGTLWLVTGQTKQFVAVRDGRVVADQRVGERFPQGGPVLVAADHVLYAQTSTGVDHGIAVSAPIAFGRFSRSVSPAIVEQPESQTVQLGSASDAEPVAFQARATADPEPAIQWQARSPGAPSFADITGEAGETLTVQAQQATGGTQYRAVFANDAGRLATEPATLTVRYPPSISFDPFDAEVVEGEDATFELLAAGSPEPEVTWQRNIGGFWEAIDPDSGDFEVDGGILTVSDVRREMDGTRFRARVRNEMGTTFSRAATLEVAGLDGPVSLRGGHVDWGFAERWRCYVVGNVAQGGVETTGGVARNPGTLARGPLCAGRNEGSETFRFPVGGGSYDPASDELVVLLGGTVRFWGHAHHGGGGKPLLDTTFSNLRIEATGDTGTLYGDAVGATMEHPKPVTHTDVAIASIELAGTGPSADGDGLAWTAAPTALTEPGAAIFGSYPPGEPFDPVAMELVYGDSAPPDPDPEPPEPEPDSDPQPESPSGLPPAGPRAERRKVARPAVRGTRGLRRVGRRRLARVAVVRCPRAGRCRVRVQRWVRVRVAGRRYVARVIVRRRVPSGGRRLVRVRLPRLAARRLARHPRARAIVRFRLAITQHGGPTTRTTVRVALKRKRTRTGGR